MKKKKVLLPSKFKVPSLAGTFGQSTASGAGSRLNPPGSHRSTLAKGKPMSCPGSKAFGAWEVWPGLW
jgi:hypothetical protein